MKHRSTAYLFDFENGNKTAKHDFEELEDTAQELSKNIQRYVPRLWCGPKNWKPGSKISFSECPPPILNS